MRKGTDIMTTGEIADVLGVAMRTASKWCDSGRIKHWRLPDSLDRRVFRDDLLEFMRANGFSARMTAQVAADIPVVAAIGLAWPLGEFLGQGVRCLETDSVFELGRLCMEAGAANLCCAVVGWSIGAEAARGVIAALLRFKEPPPGIVAVVPEDWSLRTQEVYRLGVSQVLVCPQPAQGIAQEVLRLLEGV